MIYSFTCAEGGTFKSSQNWNSVPRCYMPDGTFTYVYVTPVAAIQSQEFGLSDLTTSDISLLMSAVLFSVCLAAAWNMVGRFIWGK